MNKNRFLATVISVFLIGCLSCGCADVEGISKNHSAIEQTSGLVSNSIDDFINSTISDGGMSVSFEENNNIPTKCKIYKQKAKQFNEKQLLELFSGEPQKVTTVTEDEIKYITSTEMGFISEGTYLSYSTLDGARYYGMCVSSFDGVDGYKDGTLDFSTRDEVLDQVGTIMQSNFGIMQSEWYVDKFYAVKKETVDLYKEMVYQQANEDVTSSNEFEQAKWRELAEALEEIRSEDYYYISLNFKIDNIPVYPGDGFFYNTDITSLILGNIADVVYTKNGVESIAIGYLNETDVSSAEELDIISSDEAKYLIQQKYDDIIFDGEIEIYDMQFVYLPIPKNNLGDYFINFETRPFYAFYCKQVESNNGEMITSNFISYFDAVTGKEFGVEQI